MEAFSESPFFSVIICLEDGPSTDFPAIIHSISAQTYSNWELLILHRGNLSDDAIPPALKERISAVQITCSLIADLNRCAHSAKGGQLIFLEPGVELSPDALFHLARSCDLQPRPDIIYADEDRMTPERKLVAPLFKPDWSPEYLLHAMYTGPLLLVTRLRFLEQGGFREEVAAARIYDLLLRLTELTDGVHHVKRVLCHRLQPEISKPDELLAGQRALEEALTRRSLPAQVKPGQMPGTFHPVFKSPSPRKISIIIPTRDQPEKLNLAVESVLCKSTYENFEIIIVNNGSIKSETLALLKKLSGLAHIRVIDDPQPFNFSALNNRAARDATGDYFLFLNDDVEVISPDWMQELAGHLEISGVAAVGAKLYYPDLTIQHAGVILGLGGMAGHAHKHFPRSAEGYCGRLLVPHNLSAVTAACMLVRRDTFEELGGFDEQLAVALNDVDLCLRIRAKGQRIVFTPYAELFHHESLSRGYEDTAEKLELYYRELAFCKNRWGEEVLERDPYYHPCLSSESEDFSFDRSVKTQSGLRPQPN